MKAFIQKLNSHRLAKYLKPLAVIFLLYIAYHIYLWSITQTTDNAYIEADISYVGAEVAGAIKTLKVGDNVRVAKGDVIAEIDDENYKAAEQKAEANVAIHLQAIKIIEQKILLEKLAAEKNSAALELAKINLDLAEVDYKRTKELAKDNFSSQKLLDVSKTAFESAKNTHIAAQVALQSSNHNLILLEAEKTSEESGLKVSQQEKILADRNLKLTKLVAPIDGVVSSNNVKVGNYVGPGSIVFAVVPTDKVYIKANFKETQVAKFKPGMKVRIEFDAAKGHEVYGTIRNLSPATGSKFSLIPTDNATGNFTKVVQRIPVLIDFEIPNGINLMPGMSAIVSVKT